MSSPYIELPNLGLALVAVGISIVAYIRSRPKRQLKIDQDAGMQLIAFNALVCYKIKFTQFNSRGRAHEYSKPLMEKKAKALLESIDNAIDIGMWKYIVQDLDMYIAFSSVLELSGVQHWELDDLADGICRTIITCRNYNREMMIGGGITDALNTAVCNLHTRQYGSTCFKKSVSKDRDDFQCRISDPRPGIFGTNNLSVNVYEGLFRKPPMNPYKPPIIDSIKTMETMEDGKAPKLDTNGPELIYPDPGIAYPKRTIQTKNSSNNRLPSISSE